MRIHKTHVKAGDWSHEIQDGEMVTVEHDGLTYGLLSKDYYLDTKTDKVRWTRENAEERELFVVVGSDAFQVTHLYGTESVEDRLSLRLVDDQTVHDAVKAALAPGGRLAGKMETLGIDIAPATPRL